MLVSKVLTEPCPSKSDGSAQKCINCSQSITAGAPVIDFGRRGYSHYPTCHGAAHSAHAVPGGLDLQDQVAALLLDNRGQAGAPSADSAESAESFLAHCQSLGPPDPHTGLRRGQDLADAVAERLLETRGGTQ